MFAQVFSLMLLLISSDASTGRHVGASGNLTVSAVVTSSVSVTFTSDGKPIMVVANAPADAQAIVGASTQYLTPSDADRDQRNAKPSLAKNKRAKHVFNH
jgi:hypothetical protein